MVRSSRRPVVARIATWPNVPTRCAKVVDAPGRGTMARAGLCRRVETAPRRGGRPVAEVCMRCSGDAGAVARVAAEWRSVDSERAVVPPSQNEDDGCRDSQAPTHAEATRFVPVVTRMLRSAASRCRASARGGGPPSGGVRVGRRGTGRWQVVETIAEGDDHLDRSSRQGRAIDEHHCSTHDHDDDHDDHDDGRSSSLRRHGLRRDGRGAGSHLAHRLPCRTQPAPRDPDDVLGLRR